jgi:hypothetical protein
MLARYLTSGRGQLLKECGRTEAPCRADQIGKKMPRLMPRQSEIGPNGAGHSNHDFICHIVAIPANLFV